MKKRAISLFLSLLLCIGLLPVTAAADYIMVKKLDVIMEIPKAGMTQQEAKGLQLLYADGDGKDLLAAGAVSIRSVKSWSGEFDRTDASNPKFVEGRTYIATIQFAMAKDHLANCDMETFTTDASRFSVTVNGKPASLSMSSCSYPVVQASFTVGEQPPAPKPAEPEQPTEPVTPVEPEPPKPVEPDLKKHSLRQEGLRSSADAYSQAEADQMWVDTNPLPLVVLDQAAKPAGGYTYNAAIEKAYTPAQQLRITELVVDFPASDFQNAYQQDIFGQYIATSLPNLRRLWVSDRADVVQLVKSMRAGTEKQPLGSCWYWSNSTGFGTRRATLYVSEQAMAQLKTAFAGALPTSFAIQVYTGDVHTAQKAGTGKDWCTAHQYTAQIMAADRIYHYEDCTKDRQWFWSCALCGKCEGNTAHTFNRDYATNTPIGKLAHQYYGRTASEEAYVGVNAAGDQVYWYSCLTCGKSQNYILENPTQEDWKMSGVELSYEQYKQFSLSSTADLETRALIYSDSQPGMFTLAKKSEAKMSAWAQSDVNHALNNDLLDSDLLGSDYTKAATRLQFCSVAVRLAEQLTGKSITPAASDTFTDTRDAYALKACAAGITVGVGAGRFAPDQTLNRQEMATFMHRTLQYIAANSDLGYTAYESKLQSYPDYAAIDSWAREPLAFMNALDLIKGTASGDQTLIAPRASCTIEQALAVAARSIYAHQIGWYQVVAPTEKAGFNDKGLANSLRWKAPDGGSVTSYSQAYSDRIWVTGNRLGGGVSDLILDEMKGIWYPNACYFPTVDPFSGQTHYVEAEWYRPVR